MATQLIRDQVKIFVPRNKRSFLYIFQHHITLYPSRYKYHYASEGASLVAQRLRPLPAMQETWVQCLGQEDPLEKEMATHSSILAWRIPWTEEPGGPQSTGWQRVGHDWATSLTLSCFSRGSDGKESAWNEGDPGLILGLGRSPGEGNDYPLQCSCLENCMGRGAWRATVYGVAENQTWLSMCLHAPGNLNAGPFLL